jgi:hypothetical protein
MTSQVYQWNGFTESMKRCEQTVSTDTKRSKRANGTNGYRQRQRYISNNGSVIGYITQVQYRQQRQRYIIDHASVIVAHNGSVILDITQVWYGQQRYRYIIDHTSVVCGYAHTTIWAYAAIGICGYAHIIISLYDHMRQGAYNGSMIM